MSSQHAAPRNGPAPRRVRSVTRRRLLAGLAGLALLRPDAASAAEDDAVAALVRLVHERLDVMADVAKSKWNTGSPVEDAMREKELLDRVAAAAGDHGLDPTFAVAFFRAQIEAAKLVESALIAGWTREHAAAFADAPDLRAAIRPRLDRLNPELMRVLAAARPVLTPRDADRLAAASRLEDATTALALARALQPLLDLCRTPAAVH